MSPDLVTPNNTETEAFVKLEGENVDGSVSFRVTAEGILLEGEVTGLTAGEHGFHIHALGDLSNGCLSTGSHYNPYGKNHGAPSAVERHVGDLGNIMADSTGTAKVATSDKLISLYGVTGIVGRAVVVHAGVDDLGLGGHNESLTTGNAGARVACGIIGVRSDDGATQISRMSLFSVLTIVGLVLFVSMSHV